MMRVLVADDHPVVRTGLRAILGRQCHINNSVRASYGYDQRIEVHGSEGMLRAGNRTPTSVWVPSLRTFPERTARPEYPAHMEVRRVSRMGTIRLRQQRPFLTQVLDGQDVGLEEIDDGIWNIVYYQTLLGRLDERTRQITGA